MKRKMLKAVGLGMAAVCAAVTLTITSAASGAEEKAISGTDTVYSIASVSKMYVSAAAMQLADRGLIDIDEPVVTYIPEFEMADPRYKDITVRMLMDHSSGLMGTTENNGFLLDDNYGDWETSLLELLKEQRLKADPGDFSVYCNDGFSLLQIVVERVSGMGFTQYMAENIVKPMGCIQTGSCENTFRSPYHAPIYDGSGHEFVPEYCLSTGAGGVLSTAAEVCRFGSMFFKGNTTLLSENAKEQMAEKASGDRYEGYYALGWDDVDVYEGAGVQVLTKGGDLYKQHSALLVAPEAKISVGVCSSEGNSMLDTIFAKCLMDIALEEKGFPHIIPEKTIPKAVDSVPEEFRKYEGMYSTGGYVASVTFPDMKYMKVDMYEDSGVRTSYYKYTEDGVFAHMLGDVPKGTGVQDSNFDVLSFKVRNGRTYIISDETNVYADLGSYTVPSYEGEKIEPNPVSEKVTEVWKARQGKYYCVGGRYSNSIYQEMPSIRMTMSDELEGYIIAMGPKKIIDEDHAAAFDNIPNMSSRDQMDITVSGDVVVVDGSLYKFISEDSILQFDPDMTEVSFSKQEAKWYSIGSDIGDALVSFDKTEKTSVYVYDVMDNVIFSTYMTGFGNGVPLPPDGKIVFVGEPNERVTVNRLR